MKDTGQKGERHGIEAKKKDVKKEGEKCVMEGRKMWNGMKKDTEWKGERPGNEGRYERIHGIEARNVWKIK